MQKPKFRVWDTVEKQWYPEDNIAIDNLGNTFVFGLNTDEVDIEGREIYAVSLVDDADKQVTELSLRVTDKNGKEIYFGDIVKNKWGEVVVVEWDDERLSCFPCTAEIRGNSNWDDREEFEVIGNIHENPDLLNKK